MKFYIEPLFHYYWDLQPSQVILCFDDRHTQRERDREREGERERGREGEREGEREREGWMEREGESKGRMD